MDSDLLKKRVEVLAEKLAQIWNELGPDYAPMLRAQFDKFIVVVGVEFPKEDDD